MSNIDLLILVISGLWVYSRLCLLAGCQDIDDDISAGVGKSTT